MAGVNRDEGSMFINEVIKDINNMTLQDFMTGVKGLDAIFHGIDTQKVSDYYLKNVNTSKPLYLRFAFSDLTGDLALKCSTYSFAKQFAIAVKDMHRVYFYELFYASKTFAKILNCDIPTMGICHAMDLPFVFGLPFIRPDYEPEDAYWSKHMMDMWTKFAKDG